ncbi:MAG TPA: 50S ribosomal protein L4 [Chloroflexota bacterium]|jgi:large subunit ribosomal protein L4
MKLSVYNLDGAVVEELELSDAVFAAPIHISLMHQVVVAHQANARVGTASTKTRAHVAGTTKKIYKQKGTGRARHGSRKVPLWKGGGVAHGPHPRSYEQHTPKKMRRQAIRSALSAKVRDNQIILLQQLALERPRTKDMVGLLDRLPVRGKVLVTLDALDRNVVLSARNIPGVHTLPARSLNTLDLLKYDYLVATVPAIRAVEQWLAPAGPAAEEEEAPAAPATRRRGRAAAETATAERATAETELAETELAETATAETTTAETELAEPEAEAAAPTRRRRAAAAPPEEASERGAAEVPGAEAEADQPVRRPRARRATAEPDSEASPTEGEAAGGGRPAAVGRRAASAASADEVSARPEGTRSSDEAEGQPKRTRSRPRAETTTADEAAGEEPADGKPEAGKPEAGKPEAEEASE